MEGKIEKLTRNNWEFDRIAEEQIKIKDIIFTYRMNDQLFYPGYHAELPDSVLYKGKYVIIKYIVQGNDKRILSIEEK